MFCLLVYLLTITAARLNQFDLDFQDDNISEGQKRYTELVRKAQSYGRCWREAMSELGEGCRHLTEEVQSRLALSFTNCFLEHAGVESHPCPSDLPVSKCLRNISERVFNTYTEFFTHTQSICHYLQHREWQEEAARTVLALTESSQVVRKKLDESAKSQSQILDLQRVAFNEQKKLMTNGKILNAELVRSRESARDIYNQFKTTTHEQKLLLFEVFDRMKNLQNFVLGEFTGVYTVAYYIIAIGLIYILTSVRRTADARIWLVLIITFSAVIERILTAHSLQENVLEMNPLSTSGVIYDRIWLCRKVMCSLCLVVLLVSYHRYRDYNAINNALLQEIRQQNTELQNFIKGLTLHENIQSFSSSMKSGTMQSSLRIEETLKDRNILASGGVGSIKEMTYHQKPSPENLEDKENNYLISDSKGAGSIKEMTYHQKPSPENLEDKENNYLIADSVVIFKKTSRRKNDSPKNTTRVKSRGGTPRNTLLEGSILSDLESPTSPSIKRYNLRSSSRLNSPQQSSPYGTSPFSH